MDLDKSKIQMSSLIKRLNKVTQDRNELFDLVTFAFVEGMKCASEKVTNNIIDKLFDESATAAMLMQFDFARNTPQPSEDIKSEYPSDFLLWIEKSFKETPDDLQPFYEKWVEFQKKQD